jgi:hypothetical protein
MNKLRLPLHGSDMAGDKYYLPPSRPVELERPGSSDGCALI